MLSLGCEAPTEETGTPTSLSASTTAGVTDEGELSADELAGLGDPYYPQAGNGGYDVLHYDLSLDCDPEVGYLSGSAVLSARALVALGEFHLDFTGLELQALTVDGVSARHRREGQELIVECPQTIIAGSEFSVEVTYSGTPQPLQSAQGYPQGWQHSGDSVFTLDEPEGAATWYPLNDHPSDKATYSFRLTVPKPYVAIGNGVLQDVQARGSAQTFVWEMEEPMANYLASVVIGELEPEESVSPDGVPIRNYFTPELAGEASSAFSGTGEALDFFADLFGPYPFAVYGVVVPDATIDESAMENQTISLFGSDTLTQTMAEDFMAEMLQSHELSHQWFGNSVTPADWQDIWLNEGFATYASWLWLENEFGAQGMEVCVADAIDYASRDASVPPGDPGTEELFGAAVYERGGLTLRALHLTVGDELFFSIMWDWAQENAYGNVTTEDFIALVEEKTIDLAGFDVDAFFDAWLYDDELPELPQAATAS